MRKFLNTTKKAPDPRIFLVRHGKPEQHSGKIFLGQLDVPLSYKGRHEASLAGRALVASGACANRIYTSDLMRAKETADIIAEELGGLTVVPDKLFREMAMGAWDGELIEDIKKKFPEEYAKRGDDLRNYRVPGGESFYDLRGRVTREFYRIFESDILGVAGSPDESPCDLIIVAHLGVVTALTEELDPEKYPPGEPKFFDTGSVTMCKVPDWLWSGGSPQ
ncbi:MAG: histidine phosphatase family protein [Clostridiales bacterium]|nr:histidine phosphatase family protein [Clostridiales bacterium]